MTCETPLFQQLRPFLRKFALVFFDDILIYRPTWSIHLVQLEKFLKLLLDNKFYAKLTKCNFGVCSVDYLGHIISGNSVQADPTKVKDIAVNKVCQFMSNPLDSHWVAVKRILRYLKGTLHLGLCFYPTNIHKPMSLTTFSDDDWAADLDDRRSTSGAAVYFGPNLISWWPRKQPVVARSSTEAEYRSLAHTTAELLWLQTLLLELSVPFTPPTIFCDNQSVFLLAHNPMLHARTKHKEIDLFFVREKVLAKQLTVQHIPGDDQWADILTNPVSTAKFLSLRPKLNVTAAPIDQQPT